MDWKNFDADKEDLDTKKQILELLDKLLKENGISHSDKKAYLEKQIERYEKKEASELNEICMTQCFRPHEYDHIQQYDESLIKFEKWLRTVNVDWTKSSEELKKVIKMTWTSAGSAKLSLGRNKSYNADDFIIIDNARVVIEVETSNNQLNGFMTIATFFKKKLADFGIMIVPWTKRDNGVDEAKSLVDLDIFAELQKNTDNPIYRLAVIRKIDIYKVGLKSLS